VVFTGAYFRSISIVRRGMGIICKTVVSRQLSVVSKSPRGEGLAFPPFRQKKSERMGHGALVEGHEWNS